jgi:hypothetical protein
MILEEYINNKNSGLKAKNVPDSTLINYILTKSSSADLMSNQGLKNLSRSYIGAEKLDAKLDSIKTLQIKFIMNYLSHDKEIPLDCFRIITTAPDTISPSGNYPVFRTYFTAAGEKNE